MSTNDTENVPNDFIITVAKCLPHLSSMSGMFYMGKLEKHDVFPDSGWGWLGIADMYKILSPLCNLIQFHCFFAQSSCWGSTIWS